MEPQGASEERLLQLVKGLPETQMVKVISLAEKLREEEEKVRKENYLKAIKELHGKYKDGLSSTEEFMRRKQEEKELDL